MMYLVKFEDSLLLGLVIHAVTVCAMKDFHIGKQHFNSRLYGHTTANYFGIPSPECARKCLLLPRCRSLNYNIETSACELNTLKSSEVSPSDFSSEANWVFSDASAWPKEMAGTCADMPCGKNRMCLPTTPIFTCRLVISQTQCERHSDCADIGGFCTENQCTCPYNSYGNQACLARFKLVADKSTGESQGTGLLQMYYNGAFHMVYYSMWYWPDTEVACQLANPMYRFGGSYYWKILTYDTIHIVFSCPSWSLFTHCPIQVRFGAANVTTFIGLTCYSSDPQDMIRLSPPYNNSPYRRLEIQYNGVWGSVCATWGMDLFVEKRMQLACTSMNKSKLLRGCVGCCTGFPSVPIITRDIRCISTEATLLHCLIRWWYPESEICRNREIGMDCE